MIPNFQVNSLSNMIFSKYNCHYNRIFKKIFQKLEFFFTLIVKIWDLPKCMILI